MKTIKQIVSNYQSKVIDGRDLSRLCDFLTLDQCAELGIRFKDGYTHEKSKEYNKESVIAQLKLDVEFGFEKALDKRGISASCMHGVVAMWLWVLDVDFDEDDYSQYGLPVFKLAAEKFGFDNPIGDMSGSEFVFSCESDDYFGESN